MTKNTVLLLLLSLVIALTVAGYHYKVEDLLYFGLFTLYFHIWIVTSFNKSDYYSQKI